jgi:hypothetical protein
MKFRLRYRNKIKSLDTNTWILHVYEKVTFSDVLLEHEVVYNRKEIKFGNI